MHSMRSESLDYNYIDLLTNLSEDLLTLHVNRDSDVQQMASMEFASASSASFIVSRWPCRPLIRFIANCDCENFSKSC